MGTGPARGQGVGSPETQRGGQGCGVSAKGSRAHVEAVTCRVGEQQTGEWIVLDIQREPCAGPGHVDFGLLAQGQLDSRGWAVPGEVGDWLADGVVV